MGTVVRLPDHRAARCPARHEASLVRAACLTNYAQVASRAGLSPDRMLLDAGLDPNMLRDPDLMVPVGHVRRLLETSAQHASDEAFGLRMAMTRQLSNLGPVGLVIRDQPSVHESIRVLMRYHTALNGALAMSLEQQGPLVLVREELLLAGGMQPTRQSIELAVGVLFTLLRQLLGCDWRPQRVCFMHTAPRDRTAHLQLFGPRLEFGQAFNGIVCLASELDAPNVGADPQMARYAQQLLELTPAPTEPSTLEAVRRAIVLLLPSGRCTIEQVSVQLGLVPRSVQRRLAEQGCSFSELVNDLRVELTERHLAHGERSLTDVATLLGFAALSGFSHWHQQQFNCSPSHSRSGQAAGRSRHH
jgi:AraC-like DNA-binding protein